MAPSATATFLSAVPSGVNPVIFQSRFRGEGAAGPGTLRICNVFKPFYRLDASRTRQGSGLGMSLVAAIASLHGLSLSLGDNRPGLKVTVTGATETGGQRRG